MKSNLIYYVCYGIKQFPLLEISIESLRKFGKYDGEIIVFSDQKASIIGCNYLEVITPVYTWEEMSIGRVYFGLQIKGNYKNIGYFDNDILVMKPVDLLFKKTEYFKAQSGGSSLLIFDNGFDWPLSKDEEKLAIRQNSVCSGAFVASSNIFYNSLDIWRKTFELAPKKEWKFKEQSALNMAILRGQIKFSPLQKDIISGHKDNQSILVHYYGDRKHKMITDWKNMKPLIKD